MRRRDFLAGAAGGVLAARTAWAAPVRRVPTVLVTADAEAHVAVVNAVTGRVVRRLRTAEIPRSIENVAGVAVVAHTEIGRMTLIDTETLTLRRVIGRMGEPRYAAAHPDGRHAYVTDSKLGEVLVLDIRRGRVVGRVDVGGPARHISLDAPGRRLWTALGTRAERVAVVDTSDPIRPRLLRTFRPPFLAHDVVFSPGGERVWVTSGDRRTIAIYDAATREVLRRIPAQAPPQHVAFSETGRVAYVASGDDAAMRVHALDGRLLVESRVPLGSYNVSRGDGRVFTPSLLRGTLCLLDRNGRVRRTVEIASAAHDACFAWGR